MGHPLDDVMAALLAGVATEPDRNQVRMGALPGLEDVRVFDGPPLKDPSEPDFLVLGLSVEDAAGAFGDVTPAFGRRSLSSFDVNGLLQTRSGDTDMAPVRARVLTLFQVLDDWLADNEDLDGACDRIVLATWRYRPVQIPTGALALIEFTTRVDASRFEGA